MKVLNNIRSVECASEHTSSEYSIWVFYLCTAVCIVYLYNEWMTVWHGGTGVNPLVQQQNTPVFDFQGQMRPGETRFAFSLHACAGFFQLLQFSVPLKTRS